MKPNTILDTRAFDQRAEVALVLSLFDGLKEGEQFEVVADHSFDSLCEQLEALQSSNLQWRFLEKSPKKTRILVAKLTGKEAKGHAQGGCCGMCRG